jgi:hypothetical protein
MDQEIVNPSSPRLFGQLLISPPIRHDHREIAVGHPAHFAGDRNPVRPEQH